MQDEKKIDPIVTKLISVGSVLAWMMTVVSLSDWWLALGFIVM